MVTGIAQWRFMGNRSLQNIGVSWVG